MIQAEFIRAFVSSVENVFATMLQTAVSVREPSLRTGADAVFDVTGIIGLSGDMQGTIVLSFPREVAERVATLFSGMALEAGSEDFADAIGELVNMVSGNAKAAFPNRKCSISTPTVIVGHGHQVFGRSDVQVIELPCACDCGDFMIEVALRDNLAESDQSADPMRAHA